MRLLSLISFRRYFRYTKYIAVLICFSIINVSCHKEDPGGHQMSGKSFSEQAVSMNLLQISTTDRISASTSDSSLVLLAKKRKLQSEEYIAELTRVTDDSGLPLSDMTGADKEKLSRLSQIARNDYGSKWVEMAIESDQELIALHVKAASNTGVENAALRQWASDKLPWILERLKEIQQKRNG